MDILLTHGFFLQNDPVEQKIMKPYPPLGLLYLTAFLKVKGFHPRVFDSTFASLQDYVALLERERPTIVGLYANMMTRTTVVHMMRLARRYGAVVVVGGPDPPNYPENYLDHGADVVVFGEGEATLAELIPEVLKAGPNRLRSVAGIAYRDEEGRILHTAARPFLPDLDTLPFPDRHAVPLQRYLDAWKVHHGHSSVSLITARGCPYSCTWCSHSVYGKSLRKRSPENVVDEVTRIVEQFCPDMLWYADDVFNIQPRWLVRYAELLKRRGLNLPFECICRADRLQEDLIVLLKDMGCFRLWIGSESGSQRLLDRMKRGVRVEQVQQMTRLARRYGIETGMFLMWGYEDETEEDIALTIEHVKRALPDLVLTTVSYPIKGTEYYYRLETQGAIVKPAQWENSSDRDYRVRGRPGKRYYRSVNRWLYGELALARASGNGHSPMVRLKAHAQRLVGKLGMRLFVHQREN